MSTHAQEICENIPASLYLMVNETLSLMISVSFCRPNASRRSQGFMSEEGFVTTMLRRNVGGGWLLVGMAANLAAGLAAPGAAEAMTGEVLYDWCSAPLDSPTNLAKSTGC